MFNIPRGVGLCCFENSEGEWCAYAMLPAGPSPIRCRKGWRWCYITEGRILFKEKTARKFVEAPDG